jgi:hypothetical protein
MVGIVVLLQLSLREHRASFKDEITCADELQKLATVRGRPGLLEPLLYLNASLNLSQDVVVQAISLSSIIRIHFLLRFSA